MHRAPNLNQLARSTVHTAMTTAGRPLLTLAGGHKVRGAGRRHHEERGPGDPEPPPVLPAPAHHPGKLCSWCALNGATKFCQRCRYFEALLFAEAAHPQRFAVFMLMLNIAAPSTPSSQHKPPLLCFRAVQGGVPDAAVPGHRHGIRRRRRHVRVLRAQQGAAKPALLRERLSISGTLAVFCNPA